VRRPSEIPGGVPGLIRWAGGGVFRVAARALSTARAGLAGWWDPRRMRMTVRREDRRWARRVRHLAAGRFRLDVLLGTVSDQDVPVIVCLWNRPSRIDPILAMLDDQRSEHGVRLMLWNNNAADDEHYRRRITAFQPRGALRSVEYHSSGTNVGGLARFFLARRAKQDGTKRRQFIMVDDDQNVSRSFIGDLMSAAEPRVYGGIWAWHTIDSHWNRTAAEPGDVVDYVGTGGSICDLDIVAAEDLFTGLPRRYAFLEDQWLSAYARMHGWSLKKIDTPVEFVMHDTNQFPALAALKDEFRTYLIERSGQQTAR
jgi:hypothetical protein